MAPDLAAPADPSPGPATDVATGTVTDPDAPSRWRAPRLRWLALMGALGTAGVTLGASQGASPFTSKLAGAWFFGVATGAPPASANTRLAGVVLVYAGLIVLLASWYELVRATRHRRVVSVRPLVAVLGTWSLPLLVVGPLFSRDVYSYAAQGQMVSSGIDPYRYGSAALGHGAYARLVDPLWSHATAPYGPLWERLSQAIVALSGHDVLGSVLGLRVVAVAGIALLAWGIADLAGARGVAAPVAFVLGAMNPVVLLDLLAGAHNDALMLGLLVTACALARRGRIAVAVVVCAAAASVKLPALIGVLFIGWCWGGPGAALRSRVVRTVAVLAGAGALLAVTAWACGLGWQFAGGLSNPGVVVSWLDPATAAGLGVANALHALGVAVARSTCVSVVRAVALAAAALWSVRLFVRARPGNEEGALGWSLLAFAVLGPVVWPWYETWGLVFLAVTVGVTPRGAVAPGARGAPAHDWTLRTIVALSSLACFADIPGAHYLRGASPALAGAGWALLAAAVVAVGLRQRSVFRSRARTSSVAPVPGVGG